jgi:hypothetical protein
LGTVNFVSDAAGVALEWVNGISKNVTVDGDRGVASVGHGEGKILSVCVIKWPPRLLRGQKSSLGAYFSSKSTKLETVGFLLPFLTQPKLLQGRHVRLEVDNMAVVFAWKKKYTVRDHETSLLIRVLHVIEAFLSCKIYVSHLRRMSNQIAVIADSLSREATTTSELLAELSQIPHHRVEGALQHWLQNPVLDWDLPLKILDDVKRILKQ